MSTVQGAPRSLHVTYRALFGALALVASSGLALAQDAGDEQDRLYQQMVRQPTNYDITYKYVQVATDRGDFEAAIGALERLLYYNPDLPLVKYELGTLYYRLRSYEMAKRYFNEALASPRLDAATKARIEAYLPDADKQTQQSRFSGFAQTGLRYQSNASYSPSSGLVRFGGQDFGLGSTNNRKSDGNWFGLVGLSHDYDLQNERGDVLETRALGYLTQQFSLHDLDVGIFDGSFGPRMALPVWPVPGATFKPYVAGGNTWVGGSQYMSSIGAGLSFSLPVAPRWTVDPMFEWRHVDFASSVNSTFSEFSTGEWYTAGIASSYAFTDRIRLDSRTYYRRGESAAAYQDFNQWVGEASISFAFAAPIASSPRNWSVSPFARIVRTEFDAPNPFIDPLIARTDKQYVAGVVFDTPVTKMFGISTTVQYDKTNSTLPNYRQNNFSVLSGPTARF